MSRKQDYGIYIKSKTWRELRAKAIKLNPSCALCNSTLNLHVHHRRYPEVFGTETLDYLTVLCRGCHGNYHKYARNLPKKKKFKKVKKKKTPNNAVKVKVSNLESTIEADRKRDEGHCYILRKSRR